MKKTIKILEFHRILTLIKISHFHQYKKPFESNYSRFIVDLEDTLNYLSRLFSHY